MPSARYIAFGSSREGSRRFTCGQADDTEPEIREERERDTRDDVTDGRIAAEREEIGVDVDERDCDEDGEHGQEDEHDERLRLIDDARPDDVYREHREND